MRRPRVSGLMGALLVALAGLVAVGTAEATSMGGITVVLEGVDPATGAPVFMAVGTGTGAFSDAKPTSPANIGTTQLESFFDVLFQYDAMYTDEGGVRHDLMVRGTGQGRLPDPMPGEPSRAEMVLQANVVVDRSAPGQTVDIGLLAGQVQLDRNGNPSVFGSRFSLQNPVGPFQLPGLPPFIFPPNDHRIQGPEPSALLLLGAGLTGLGALAWRRRRSG